MKRTLLKLLFLFLFLDSVSGQKRSSEIGFKLINELANGGDYAPGIGIQAIYKITAHSGIETGFYYKINPEHYLVHSPTPSTAYKRYNEKVIQLPLLYRFESKPINFTAGFAAEYFINRKEISEIVPSGYFIQFQERLTAVATIGVSKSFNISKLWVFEPELRVSAPIPEGGVGIGINLSLRKKIF